MSAAADRERYRRLRSDAAWMEKRRIASRRRRQGGARAGGAKSSAMPRLGPGITLARLMAGR